MEFKELHEYHVHNERLNYNRITQILKDNNYRNLSIINEKNNQEKKKKFPFSMMILQMR